MVIIFNSCKNEKAYEPSIEVIRDFSSIEHLFNKDNDTVYVINFWATTCPPCLKEMPIFEKISVKKKDSKFKTYFINIDEEERLDKFVLPLLKKIKIKNKVYSLIDENATVWTGKINKEWFGALPYTIIYKGKNKKFFFGAFKDEQELEKEIEDLMN